MENSRQSNFELLRIFAMISILFGHFVTKGGMVFSNSCIQQKFSLILWGGGKLGVCIFALLTGYFANEKNQNKKIVKIWFELLFFSLISLVLYLLFDFEAINMELIRCILMPVSMETWWYMSIYVFILALSPYIFKGIDSLDIIEYRRLMRILLIGFMVVPTLIYKANPYFSNLGWLLVLYIVGYYFHKFFSKNRPLFFGLSFFIALLIMWISELLLEGVDEIETNYFAFMYRAPMFIAAVSIFLLFKGITIRRIDMVNRIAKGTIGVYLLHDSLFFRTHWYSFIRTEGTYGSWSFILQMIISSLVLYAGGYIVDALFLFLWDICCKKLNYKKMNWG